ncbi:MAG: hypothetical protein MZV64_31895 [Ignavibacteriales bacterium]|nr:hypothetical protein [Ignavibacteriales bacterium]
MAEGWRRDPLPKGIGSVVIEVEDNGTGMGPEVMERIFEPFFYEAQYRARASACPWPTTSSRSTTGPWPSSLSRAGDRDSASFSPLGTPGRIFAPPSSASGKMAAYREVRSSFLNMIQLPLVQDHQEDVEQAILEHPEVDLLFAHHSGDIQEYIPLLEEVSSRFPLLTVIVTARTKCVKACAPAVARARDTRAAA